MKTSTSFISTDSLRLRNTPILRHYRKFRMVRNTHTGYGLSSLNWQYSVIATMPSIMESADMKKQKPISTTLFLEKDYVTSPRFSLHTRICLWKRFLEGSMPWRYVHAWHCLMRFHLMISSMKFSILSRMPELTRELWTLCKVRW